MAIPVGVEQAWPLDFRPLAFASLTSFLVFTVRGRRGSATSAIAFTINARLVNAPANRREQVLRHMLKDRSAVMRFLFLLLADLSDDPTILQEVELGGSGSVARRTAPQGPFELVVGPEGGLSERERDLALSRGGESVGLGPRVLRTETASLAALAAIHALWGDFRG